MYANTFYSTLFQMNMLKSDKKQLKTKVDKSLQLRLKISTYYRIMKLTLTTMKEENMNMLMKKNFGNQPVKSNS